MNLMNIVTHQWDNTLLEIYGGPELRSKLGPEPMNGGTFIGKISPWWVKRWGFNPGKTASRNSVQSPLNESSSAQNVLLHHSQATILLRWHPSPHSVMPSFPWARQRPSSSISHPPRSLPHASRPRTSLRTQLPKMHQLPCFATRTAV